jgi:hypothetical protein
MTSSIFEIAGLQPNQIAQQGNMSVRDQRREELKRRALKHRQAHTQTYYYAGGAAAPTQDLEQTETEPTFACLLVLMLQGVEKDYFISKELLHRNHVRSYVGCENSAKKCFSFIG